MTQTIHNRAVLDSLEEGDLIEIARGLYSHWAVYSATNYPFSFEKAKSCVYLKDEIEYKCKFHHDLNMYSYALTGNEEVIHLAGDEGHSSGAYLTKLFSVCGVPFNKVTVKIENFWKVVNNSRAKKNNIYDWYYRYFSPKDIVKRARGMIGPVEYNLLWNNCEHFASWCRYGTRISTQADKTLLTANDVGTTATVVGAGAVLGALAYKNRKDRKESSKL
ncbi:unnamed protein product [Mytilus edulis]|uniref:LRAT domain-containing protein n=1 Tax=Mytilus edulis TaxID=6550 RepID=A0A8S3VIH9_MYTED|nr:unnamed protein product [Mytilus edulis]